jgi:hypothetical protein
MKIHQLLSGVGIAITNEEQRFVSRHNNNIRLSSLDEHDIWVAQSLVRKGFYSISKDNSTLSKNINETSN